MRKLLLFFLLFNGTFILSQNSENIYKIKFGYYFGGSSWGKNGIYSRSEIIEIMKTENGDYKISKQVKVKNKASGNDFSNDSMFIKTSEYKIIPKEEIDFLLNSLNTNEDNFTEEFLKQNFTKPTQKEILKIAKENDNKSYLKNNYDEKSDTKKKYSEIQEFKYFDEYLKLNKPNLNEYILTVDAWNIFEIITFAKEETKLYNLEFSKHCGQPISIHQIEIDEKGKKINVLENKIFSIINLKVNLILLKILPENTKLSGQLNLNKIRDHYIDWFLEYKVSEFKY